MKRRLAEANITVLGFASDADPRLLKAMKLSSGLGSQITDDRFIEWNNLFYGKLDVNFVCFQDLFHIISKMRTRLLETSWPMRIGHFKISLGTLRVIILNISSVLNVPENFSTQKLIFHRIVS